MGSGDSLTLVFPGLRFMNSRKQGGVGCKEGLFWSVGWESKE